MIRRPMHKPFLLAGMACLALGGAMPYLRRGGILPGGLGDILHGFLLGLAIGMLLMALRRGRRPEAC